MRTTTVVHIVSAFSLGLSTALLSDTQEQEGEDGPAAAAIVIVGSDPGLTIEGLRPALHLTHSGTVRLINRLVERGFLERKQCETDRRAVNLYLTNEGRLKRSDILAIRHRRVTQTLAALTLEEREIFGQLTDKVLQKLLKDQSHLGCGKSNRSTCSGCWSCSLDSAENRTSSDQSAGEAPS